MGTAERGVEVLETMLGIILGIEHVLGTTLGGRSTGDAFIDGSGGQCAKYDFTSSFCEITVGGPAIIAAVDAAVAATTGCGGAIVGNAENMVGVDTVEVKIP